MQLRAVKGVFLFIVVVPQQMISLVSWLVSLFPFSAFNTQQEGFPGPGVLLKICTYR